MTIRLTEREVGGEGWEEEERRDEERFFGDGVIGHGTREGLCVILSNRMPRVPMPVPINFITSTHRLRGRLPRLHLILPFRS